MTNKFKVGDKVYHSQYNIGDWQYKVLAVGLRNHTGDESVLLEYTKTPDNQKRYLGTHYLGPAEAYSKITRKIKFDYWLIYYTDPGAEEWSFSSRKVEYFETKEAASRDFVTCNPSYTIIAVVRDTREFEVDDA